jgi:hypothetical protein
MTLLLAIIGTVASVVSALIAVDDWQDRRRQR